MVGADKPAKPCLWNDLIDREPVRKIGDYTKINGSALPFWGMVFRMPINILCAFNKLKLWHSFSLVASDLLRSWLKPAKRRAVWCWLQQLVKSCFRVENRIPLTVDLTPRMIQVLCTGDGPAWGDKLNLENANTLASKTMANTHLLKECFKLCLSGVRIVCYENTNK